MNKTIALLSLLLLGFCSSCTGMRGGTIGLDGKPVLSLSTDTRSGSGFGPEIISNAGMTNPGLAGFNFNFIGEVDDEIERIEVMSYPLGMEIEYSPSLPNHREYSWKVNRQELPSGTKHHIITGSAPGGATVLPRIILQAEGVPVLVGFHIWRGINNEVSTFEIHVYRSPRNPTSDVMLYIRLGDENMAWGDPPFSYKVEIAMVPERKVTCEVHHSSGRAVTKSDFRKIKAKYPVLQGFRLSFVDDDGHSQEHNLDEVGVLITVKSIQVAYNDKNDDDKFRWDVWYADVKEFAELTDPAKTAVEPVPGRIETLPKTQ